LAIGRGGLWYGFAWFKLSLCLHGSVKSLRRLRTVRDEGVLIKLQTGHWGGKSSHQYDRKKMGPTDQTMTSKTVRRAGSITFPLVMRDIWSVAELRGGEGNLGAVGSSKPVWEDGVIF